MNLVKRIIKRAYYEVDHTFRIEYHKYKYMSDTRCIKKIANIKRKHDQKKSLKQIIAKIEYDIEKKPNRSITLIFEGKVVPRHIKLIKGLKDAGAEVKVVMMRSKFFQCSSFENISVIVDECIVCNNTFELMAAIIDFNSYVVHYFTIWGDCDRVIALLCHKKLFPTIVVERYDIISEMYSKHCWRYIKQGMKMEKKCFEMAEAICAREYTLDFLREKGYHISAREIVFLDYI